MIPQILIIVTGGVAAYKSLDLIRILRHRGLEVTPVFTKAASAFVTPLALTACAGRTAMSELLQPEREGAMSHITLARSHDLIAVVPATADFLARIAHGHADDLATTLLLAATTPPLIAPAMNVAMWEHPATRDNIQTLRARGAQIIMPTAGQLACGEEGIGRLAAVEDIANHIIAKLQNQHRPLSGKRILVTAGPTQEMLDSVRILSNRSSGKQGYAIAAAAKACGADVILASGPVALPPPPGVHTIAVTTAQDMRTACLEHLPYDAAICTAAVSDWSVPNPKTHKFDKKHGIPSWPLIETPDILATLSTQGQHRPKIVVGFCAQNGEVAPHAWRKKQEKKCDWMIANDISQGVIGSDHTQLSCWMSGEDKPEIWPVMPKTQAADRLIQRLAQALSS